MLNIVVKKSKISGKGVFAVKNFNKDEIVIDWTNSKDLSKDELKQLPAKELNYTAYCNGKWVLQKSPAKYVNHCCEPNTFAKNFCDIALRNIKKGEEITSDYTKCPVAAMNIKCECKSKKCRKIIK